MKPRVFIGSSEESLDVAYALQENLDKHAECTVWDQDIFQLSKYTLETLITELDNFDFGIFVFTPDDIVKIREKEYISARDNVVLELGLFVGRLGKERNFVVIPRGQENLHLPTDLIGLTLATYEPNRQDANLNAALGPGCNKIRKVFKKIGLIQKSQEHADLDDVPILLSKLKDGESSKIRNEAAKALRKVGKLGGPEVLKALKDAKIDVKNARSTTLQNTLDAAIKEIESNSYWLTQTTKETVLFDVSQDYANNDFEGTEGRFWSDGKYIGNKGLGRLKIESGGVIN